MCLQLNYSLCFALIRNFGVAGLQARHGDVAIHKIFDVKIKKKLMRFLLTQNKLQ